MKYNNITQKSFNLFIHTQKDYDSMHPDEKIKLQMMQPNTAVKYGYEIKSK